jgi:hypothetical protein
MNRALRVSPWFIELFSIIFLPLTQAAPPAVMTLPSASAIFLPKVFF